MIAPRTAIPTIIAATISRKCRTKGRHDVSWEIVGATAPPVLMILTSRRLGTDPAPPGASAYVLTVDFRTSDEQDQDSRRGGCHGRQRPCSSEAFLLTSPQCSVVSPPAGFSAGRGPRVAARIPRGRSRRGRSAPPGAAAPTAACRPG